VELVCGAFSLSILFANNFLGHHSFATKHPQTSQYQVKSTMAATSSNKGILAPTLVGAGLGNAAKGSGMAGGKRNASLSPLKLRVSSNLDGRRCILWPESPSKSDIADGDTRARSRSKKTRSAVRAPAQSTKAPESSVSPAGQGARSKTASLVRCATALLPTRRAELADASEASKVASRAPKPTDCPVEQAVRSKTARPGLGDPQGDGNEVQGEAPWAEL
jgi:hypothetical protein